MKTLVLLRHAESGWDLYGNDKDRRLTAGGREDAEFMAAELSRKNIHPDTIICSPAARAIETAGYLLHLDKLSGAAVQLAEALYPGNVYALYHTIETIPDNNEQAIIVAHNPVLSDIANEWQLMSPVNLPSGSAFACRTDSDTWSSFAGDQKEFLFYIRPR